MIKLNETTQVLREAAAKASKSLGQLFEIDLTVETLSLRKGKLREVIAGDAPQSDEIVGAVFKIDKTNGYFVFSMTPQNARICTRRLSPGNSNELKADSELTFDERDKSIITEVANIFAGSFLGALADSQKLSIGFGAPGFVQDSSTAILDGLISDVTRYSPIMTKVDIQIASEGAELKATVFMINPSDEHSTQPMVIEPIIMDALTELASIGASYASTALYQKCQTAVRIDVPRVLMLGADPNIAARKINSNMSNPIVISHEFHGRSVNGDLLLVLDSDHLKTLINKCYNLDVSELDVEESIEMQQQIKQFAQTISGAFILAMGQEVDIAFVVDVAQIVHNPFEKVLADKVDSIGVQNICAFLINFKVDQTDAEHAEEVTGFICLMLNRNNIDELLNSLRERLKRTLREDKNNG